MELIKGKEFISQKLNWLHKGGLKAIEKVTGNETTSDQDVTQDPNQNVIQGQTIAQDGTPTTTVDQNNAPPPVTATVETKKSEETEEFDDELLWSKQYSYDEFIDSLSHEYEERGVKEEEKRHWNYPRRWMVKLFNLKIVNLTTENFSCFAEFDFGGSRNECRVQIGSNNYILNSGKSKNYIRTPVLKNVEKDSSRSFNCSHSFEYRGSYLDLENEKLRIKVWKCNTYTINTLESIYEEVLIKFAEGDEHVDIQMYKYVGGQKKLTCRLSFNLFFQELYDFEINLINFKIQNAISSYYLFNYQRLHLSKLNNGSGESNDNAGSKNNDDMKDWNMINKLKYSIFKFKMERKMSKIDAKSKKMAQEDLEEEAAEQMELDNVEQSYPNSDMSNVGSEMSSPKNDGSDPENSPGASTQTSLKESKSSKKSKEDKKKKREEEKLLRKKEKEELEKMKMRRKIQKKRMKGGKKIRLGVGFVTTEEDNKNRDTTLVFMSKNKEYISILRENTQLFVSIGTFIPFECKLPPSPRLSIKLKVSGINLKKMGLMSHSVRNAFSCEWDNLGEIQFRGTLSELSSSFLEIKLLDWSAPKAANCIGIATIPLESVVDYPFISSKLYAPEWLALKSQYEGWGDKLPDLQLGSVSGSLIINRKPRYRQIRGSSSVSSSNQLLIININNIDQLLVNTQEKVNSFVEVTFNNFTARTNICKDMLGPIYNEELYIPIQNDLFGSINTNTIAGYEELLAMGPIRITVWGYVMDKLNYFGSCEIGIREIFFNKNSLRPLSKKTHNLGDTFKYETTYETRVYNATKKIYHYLYNEQDNISNINFSVWFFPFVPVNQNTNKTSTAAPVLPKVGANVNAIREQMARENKEHKDNEELKLEDLTEEDKINRLTEIWKRICLVSNNEHFIDYYYFFDQFGIKMFASSFIQVLHPPPSVETLNHIFHFVSCVSFTNKNLQSVFSIDFLLKLKNGHVLDHCLLLCSFLINNYNNVYVAIGQQKDKRYNAFVIQIYSNDDGSDQEEMEYDDKEENDEIEKEVEKETKNEGDRLVIYDLIVNQVVRINLKKIDVSNSDGEVRREELLGKDWVKKEMRKLNFVTINILFNNKNVWLNVQENKTIALLDYDINNINNWYPYIPYNPTKVLPSQYYYKIINTINTSLSNNANVQTTPCNKTRDKELLERKYHIDWNRLNDYVIDKMEVRLLEELNRNIEIYRSSQNLNTNYNKCTRLQKFLKKYLVLVHEENISNEDNLKLIKSQINEWKEDLEKRIPRSYQVLIRTVHFNTVDSGVMFDVMKHKLNFLDSRESTSIFVTTIKIFQLSSNLFSTYFMIMYSSKIHEKLRKEILLHRYLVNKKINANKKKKITDKGDVAEEDLEEEAPEQMEIEQLLVDNEEILEEGGMERQGSEKRFGIEKKDSKKARKGDLVDVINKNLKMQTKNFNKLKTRQLNNLTSFNKSGTYSSELISLSSTPRTSSFSSSCSSSDLLESEDDEDIKNKKEKKTKGRIVGTKLDKKGSEEDFDHADKEELLNMPSYEFSTFSTDSFLDKGSSGSKSSSILKSILTNSNLYSSDVGSRSLVSSTPVSSSVTFMSKGSSTGNLNSEFSSDMASRSYTRKSTREGSQVISYRGNTNLHSTLEFSSKSSVQFGSSGSSTLPLTTGSFKNLNTIASTDTLKTLKSEIKEEDEEGKEEKPLEKSSDSFDALDSEINSALISVANSNVSKDTSSSSESKSSKDSRRQSSRSSKKETTSTITSSSDYPSDRKPVVNKKLMLNSKIIKNKNSSQDIISNLDRFSNLNSLSLSNDYKSGSELNVDEDKETGLFGKVGFLNNIFNTGESSSSSSATDASKQVENDMIKIENKEDNRDKDVGITEKDVDGRYELESSSYFSSISDFTTTSSTNSDLVSEKEEFRLESSLDRINSVKSRSSDTNSDLKNESNDSSFTFNANLKSKTNSNLYSSDVRSRSLVSSTPVSSSVTFVSKGSSGGNSYVNGSENKGTVVDENRNIFNGTIDSKMFGNNKIASIKSSKSSSDKQKDYVDNVLISSSRSNKSSLKQSNRSKNTIDNSGTSFDSFGSSVKSSSDFSSVYIKSSSADSKEFNDLGKNNKLVKGDSDQKLDTPLSTTTSNEEVLFEDDYLDNLSFLNKPIKSGSLRKEELMKKNAGVRASKELAEKLFNSVSISKSSSNPSRNSMSFSSSSFSSNGNSLNKSVSRGSSLDNNLKSESGDGKLMSSSSRSESNLSKNSMDPSNHSRSNGSKSSSVFGSGSLNNRSTSNNSLLSSSENPNIGRSKWFGDSVEISKTGSVNSALLSSSRNTSSFSSSSVTNSSNTERESMNPNLISSPNNYLTSSSFSSNFSGDDLNENNSRMYRKVNVYRSFAS